LSRDLDRAPCPAPPPCVWCISLHNIFLLSPSQCRQPERPWQTDPHQPVLEGPGACSSWYIALHTCSIYFVCLPNFCFLPSLPHRPIPILGGVSRLLPSFWVYCVPPYSGCTACRVSPPSHLAKVLLFRELPSFSVYFHVLQNIVSLVLSCHASVLTFLALFVF
jgi:hypothetical protein